MAEERACSGREEKEQIDSLGGPMVDAKEEGHDKEQESPAAHAPGRDNAGPQAAEKGQNPGSHSR